MTAGESFISQRRTILGIVAIAAVLVAAVIGLSCGKNASPDTDPGVSVKETFTQVRGDALREVEETTSEVGFGAGKMSGARQGKRAGRRAGWSDGKTEVQRLQTEAAQAAAASAQSELNALGGSPPPP
jgi:hypothetical protein